MTEEKILKLEMGEEAGLVFMPDSKAQKKNCVRNARAETQMVYAKEQRKDEDE